MLGEINGSFKKAFLKLSDYHAKQGFAFAILTGDVFAPGSSKTVLSDIADLIAGRVHVPVTTYFSIGMRNLPQSVVEHLRLHENELCENLFFVGSNGSFKTTDGVRIAALGGIPVEPLTSRSDPYDPCFTLADARSLGTTEQVDILLTSHWPAKITSGTDVSDQDLSPDGLSPVVDDLVQKARPRYHFSTSQKFWMRRPIGFQVEAGWITSRFHSLAPFGNADGQKWIHAFSLDTEAQFEPRLPDQATLSPFVIGKSKRPRDESDSPSRWQHDTSHGQDSRPRGKRRHHNKHDNKPDPSECYMCLSNPNLADHLVSNIGTNVYVSTSRGPLLRSNEASSDGGRLPFPSPVVITPIPHVARVTDDRPAAHGLCEMVGTRDLLNEMLVDYQGGKFGSVAWEIRRARGIHAIWHWMPVNRQLIDSGGIEAAFRVEAQASSLGSLEESRDSDGTEDGDCFNAWIWVDSEEERPSPCDCSQWYPVRGKTRKLSIALDENERFDHAFGRRVMAKVLGRTDRVKWQDCLESKVAEEQGRDLLKEQLDPFWELMEANKPESLKKRRNKAGQPPPEDDTGMFS